MQKRIPRVFESASEELKNDKDFIIAFIKNYDAGYPKYISYSFHHFTNSTQNPKKFCRFDFVIYIMIHKT